MLHDRGFRIDSVVAESGPYVAALVRRHSDQALHLVALRRDPSSVTLLHDPEPMMEGYPPHRVDWLRLDDSGTVALLYTHDLPVEGVIGTVVYSVVSDSLARTFRSEPNECKPADVRDLDGDGHPELVIYTQDPSGGQCGSECHLELGERFGIGPQWAAVHRWTGTRWQLDEAAFPGFYADLATRYRSVQQWLDGADAAATRHCTTPRWMRNKSMFRAWAQRAEEIVAKGHR